jgi:hypothetical protein
MSERRHEQFNTHAPDRKFEAAGAPSEEDLSEAQMADQLDTEPDEAVNRTAATSDAERDPERDADEPGG